jgi:hypothetical protein
MKRRGFGRKTATSLGSVSPPAPALPAWKAFVVQFSHDAGIKRKQFSGRVEHLSSGRRQHFASAEELLDALRDLLENLEPPGE